ncbi:hypothetical protein CCHR01_19828 [Colletotrichum chrysophilum]|uniref:Uncharacterized protein n=1 Tax=Colletotrichum chrysophilum TaxID=1836956 RepID=A0AAD8ZYA8_9PEZI|nr:hypothetical protein CCHR01_19828 [Colletotrichum chrysophilum]
MHVGAEYVITQRKARSHHQENTEVEMKISYIAFAPCWLRAMGSDTSGLIPPLNTLSRLEHFLYNHPKEVSLSPDPVNHKSHLSCHACSPETTQRLQNMLAKKCSQTRCERIHRPTLPDVPGDACKPRDKRKDPPRKTKQQMRMVHLRIMKIMREEAQQSKWVPPDPLPGKVHRQQTTRTETMTNSTFSQRYFPDPVSKLWRFAAKQ